MNVRNVLFSCGLALACAAPFGEAITHSIEVSRLTSDSTLRRGPGTGFRFNLSCPEAFVLIGIDFRAGGVIDNVVGRCSAISAAGNWTGSQVLTGSAGGPGGTASARLCPANHALSGFRGQAGGAIDRLILECTKLSNNGTFDTSTRATLSAVGGTGGTVFSMSRCTRPARAIIGTATVFVHSFEFACENNSPLITGAQIGANLTGATNMLRTDSGSGDVSCDVTVVRTGRLRIEPSNGLFNISSADELDRACSFDGFAVVTNQITYCSGIGSSIVGCARPGCMVVVPLAAGVGSTQLWAHEFGHTRALPHRTGTATVMNPSLNNGDQINSEECGAYVNPVTAFFFSFLPAQEAQPDMTLEEFVSQTFIHGVPYDRAAKYGAAAVPQLISILRDGRREAAWSNAATMLAIIGDPKGVDAVIEFIDKVNPADPQGARAWARSNAVVALGYAAGPGNSARAFQYLSDGLVPGAWAKRGIMIASRGAADADAEGDDEGDVDQQLTESALIGLALSGRPEARVRLEAVAAAPGVAPLQRDLVAGLLPEHAKIAQRGIVSYDLDRRAQAADRAAAELRSRTNPRAAPDALAPGTIPPPSAAPGPPGVPTPLDPRAPAPR